LTDQIISNSYAIAALVEAAGEARHRHRQGRFETTQKHISTARASAVGCFGDARPLWSAIMIRKPALARQGMELNLTIAMRPGNRYSIGLGH
jgi:hypothetical protein